MVTTNTNWNTLRSDIYLRDKGICWICNTFVQLNDYDLGHIVDRCNGGHDDYDNLAVMHKSCNLSKPRHYTLEEALKWKLTAFINKPNKTTYIKPTKEKRLKRTTRIICSDAIPLEKLSLHKRGIHEANIAKIKPNTLTWIQGRPQGGPMWKVLPPPYRQDDLFSMRYTPPGATDNGYSGIRNTIQVINGTINEVVTVYLGTLIIYLTPEHDNILVKVKPSNSSNNNILRSKTVGMGVGQIPIEAWHNAKLQGVPYIDFIAHYNGPLNNHYGAPRRQY